MLVLALALGGAALLPLRADDSGLFVAVGYGGRRVSSRDGYTWKNDQRWSDETRDNDDVLWDVAYGSGRFVAVGGGEEKGHVLSTTDGREWHALPTLPGRVATVTHGNGRFVAMHGAELLTSMDGEKFEAGQRLEWKGNVRARRSACGDTEAGFRYVIIGDLDVPGDSQRVEWRAVTGDGRRWDHTALATPAARDVAYGGGNFVVVGPDGLVESSHDGQTWQARSAGAGEDFSRIVWTGTRFLVGGGRTVWSSADGFTWQRESLSTPGPLAWAREGLRGFTFSWVSGIEVSRDFVRWQKGTMAPGPLLKAMAYRPPAAANK